MAYISPWLKTNDFIEISSDGGTTYTSLPDPASMTITIQDLDSSKTGRGQDGNLFRDRVGIKEKIKIEFPPMYQADYHSIVKLITGSSFLVRFFSPNYYEKRVATMYVGDRQSPFEIRYSAADQDHNIVSKASMDFIEF